MHVEGVFAPETVAEARDRYESCGPVAQTVVREVAKAMSFDREEYGERVTGDVIATARDALFASMLEVTVGTAGEFDEFCEANPGLAPDVEGSDNVDRVVWHPAPFADAVVAATFQDEEDAAVSTLRRQAFGKVYRDRV